jgi:hypothetical protein
MPPRCGIDPRLPGLLRSQDHVLHRAHAMTYGLTHDAIRHRLATRQWQAILPAVYLTAPTEPTRRQLLIVHVVVPWGEAARTQQFVVVRRTRSPIHTIDTERVRYVDVATAVVVAARAMRRDRSAVAAISEALQRRLTTYDALVRAHVQGPPRGSRIVSRSLASLSTGAASAPEVDFLRLVALCPLLPTPLCNVLLRLPCGRLISPDALFVSSGVIHETNGRRVHARADLFEDMQQRHDVLTAAGFTVLHNSPNRLLRQPREAMSEVERCHLRNDGRGLPPGVTIVARAA